MKSRRDIDRLFETGRRIAGDHVTVLWEASDRFAYGVFLSGNFRPASARNRAKRLFREAIRLNRKLLGDRVKVAVIPKARTEAADFKTIDAEIGRLFTLLQSQAKKA